MSGYIIFNLRKDDLNKSMKIREAELRDLDELMKFYKKMCEFLGRKSFLPNGNKGGFPSRKMVEDAIQQHDQFIGEEDGRIMAAYIMDHECNQIYDTVQWQIKADRNEIMILHALRVLPEYAGRGYSKKLVEHAIQRAKAQRQRAIRLDCIEGNDVPQKMYMSFGFHYIDTVEITYADVGVPRKFLVFELLL